MTSTTRTQRRYDHRLREMVCNSKNIDAAVGCGVPRSTARGWLAPMTAPVVTLPAINNDNIQLQQILVLRRRPDRLVSLLRLITLLLKVADFSLAGVRLPEGTAKTRLLRAQLCVTTLWSFVREFSPTHVWVAAMCPFLNEDNALRQ